MQDWYDTQAGDFAAAYGDLPPEVPLSDASVGTVTQLSHGCWQLVVSPRPNGPDPKWGRPKQVRQGAEGPSNTAPIFTIGLQGRWAPLTATHWFFIVTDAPPLSATEENAMLLGPGDKLLFEETDGVWNIRVEFLQQTTSEEIRRLRTAPPPSQPTAPKL